MFHTNRVYPNHINTLRPRKNGRHFANDSFKYIFSNENVIISAKVSLKFVPKGSFNIIPALVKIMAWRRPGNKPLSKPMMVILPTHIYVTRPQWVSQAVSWQPHTFEAVSTLEKVVREHTTHSSQTVYDQLDVPSCDFNVWSNPTEWCQWPVSTR